MAERLRERAVEVGGVRDGRVRKAEQSCSVRKLEPERRQPELGEARVVMEQALDKQLLENPATTVVEHDHDEQRLDAPCRRKSREIVRKAHVADEEQRGQPG